MRNNKKQVAVLDIGSGKISAVVAERGINKTFVIKARKEYAYEGYSEGVFFDVDGLKKVLFSACDFLKQTLICEENNIFVGVPGAFVEVLLKDAQISFSKKKKITDEEINALYDAAFVMKSNKKTLINRSAIVYELEDFRRLVNPVGATSEILKGKLSFSLCDNSFIDLLKIALNTKGFSNVEFVSTPLAEALYLVDPEARDRIAVMCDVGYISSTFSIVQGDGILYQKSFDYGGGYITASIAERYSLEFEEADSLKRKINLSKCPQKGVYDVVSNDAEDQLFYVEELKTLTESSLDCLCEEISKAIDESGYSLPDYVSLMITGGGISFIRGAKEHVANRLNMPVEIISPKVPLMEKPTESSVLSLLDLALDQ